MTDNIERLQKFDNQKLIDIVKNYKQYGYDETLRLSAISILNERGISKDFLEKTGNFEKSYNRAEDLYNAFNRTSTIAFILYGLLLCVRILLLIITDNDALLLFSAVFYVVGVITYLIFLIKSFINEVRFYRVTGEDYGLGGAFLYMFLGVPLYIIMYFYFRHQVKEKMMNVR